MEIYAKISVIFILFLFSFHDIIIYSDFTRIAAS